MTQCSPFAGHASDYQDLGRRLTGAPVHCWISPTCEQEMCLEHIRVTFPNRIQYPPETCIYCGEPSQSEDHLIPSGFSGPTARRQVATVPACMECNRLLGDTFVPNVTQRRVLAHRRLARKHAGALRTREFAPEELSESGRGLREYITQGMAAKRRTEQRLAFPWEADYDSRAFEATGILDPHAAGYL